MSADVYALPPEAEGETPAPKRRETPQPEVPGRAALCTECLHLLDSVGHVWVCVAPNGRLR
jgi:hypothetical protein